MENKDIEHYYKTLSEKIKVEREIVKKTDHLIASKFDALNFFKPGENKTSEILAYFLNPRASHAQGVLYLKLFIEYFNISHLLNQSLEHAKIKCEKVIDRNRRMDIYIDIGSFKIGIENKIWAIDQPNQLKDYASYLSKNSTDYLLFYLTPNGKLPDEQSIAQKDFEENEKLVLMSYKRPSIEGSTSIVGLIEIWRNNTKPENVRNFLSEFLNHLNKKYMPSPTESKFILDYALESESNLEVFNLTAANFDNLKTRLIESFFEKQLIPLLDKMGLKYELGIKIDKQIIKYRHFRIFNDMMKNNGFTISFWFDYAGRKYDKLNYAFIRSEKNVEALQEKELLSLFQTKFYDSKSQIGSYGTVIISNEFESVFMWDENFKSHSLKILKGKDSNTENDVQNSEGSMIQLFYNKIVGMLEVINEVYKS